METLEMGRVTTTATVENYGDLWNADQGALPPDQVRKIEIASALVDTGATLLSLPTRMIAQLGLRPVTSKRIVSSKGTADSMMYSAVRLTIMGRSCTVDVMEVPDDVPPLVGQIPLEHLDFVVDPRNQKLIGNPRHGGEHIYEMY
ncbi:MAG: aspartyl protease family protein [Pirellulaceae bacterium]|nr:aspartyl protease family protein [Pirellulaceae bacterium]